MRKKPNYNRLGKAPGFALVVNPLFPALRSGPGSLNGLNPKSKFLAIKLLMLRFQLNTVASRGRFETFTRFF